MLHSSTSSGAKTRQRRLSKAALALLLLAALATASCDDNTATLGIYPETDGITNSTAIYQLTTRSLKMDSVVASSTVSSLGNIIDPETGVSVKADFAAQFYTFEDYEFPAKNLMIGEVDGKEQKGVVQCDSVEIRLYFDDYYGDGNNPMKLEVYELSQDNLLEEDSTYYTDLDLSQFLKDNAQPIASRVFTPLDYNLDESELTSSSHSHNVHIMLDRELGQRLMEKYYEDPSNYKDSYTFIRNVFPGLYFTTSNGIGTMLSVYVGTCNVYFHYGDEEEEDSVYVGMSRFTATPEVIQTTHFSNGDMSKLIDDTSCTYLKTPAGICTELTLPIDEVFSGEHSTDSVSLASVTLTRYNKEQNDYQLGTPSTLLMVRKADYGSFFRDKEVSDSRTSYTTSFSSTYNTYTFDNICRLLAYCKHEKINEAQKAGITEDEWAAQHPDWNKVLLIPVTTSSNTSGTEVSVNHDMSLGSIRLVGGDTKIDMQVVYSKFYQEY